jgi:hypothetical protein
MAHRDISRRRSNSVAFGAKRTFSEPERLIANRRPIDDDPYVEFEYKAESGASD